LVRHAGSRRIRRAAITLGATVVGLALTTSVAGALLATPDVTVAAAASPGALAPGTSFTWTLVARNSGAATAHDVVISSSLPPGARLVSPPPACLVGSALRCSLGDLEPGAGVRTDLHLSIQPGTCGELRSVVSISASDEPPVARNDDTAVASTSVDCSAAALDAATTLGLPAPDLVVDATSDAAGPIRKGHAVRYSLTVTNAGAGAAHHVVVTDRLPSGVEPINLLPKMDGGSCSAVGSTEGRAAFTIICVRSALDAGASAVVTIDIRVGADRPCGPMRNRVTVSANDEPGPPERTTSRRMGIRSCVRHRSTSARGVPELPGSATTFVPSSRSPTTARLLCTGSRSEGPDVSSPIPATQGLSDRGTSGPSPACERSGPRAPIASPSWRRSRP